MLQKSLSVPAAVLPGSMPHISSMASIAGTEQRANDSTENTAESISQLEHYPKQTTHTHSEKLQQSSLSSPTIDRLLLAPVLMATFPQGQRFIKHATNTTKNTQMLKISATPSAASLDKKLLLVVVLYFYEN